MKFASVTYETLIDSTSKLLNRHLVRNFEATLFSFKIVERNDVEQSFKVLALSHEYGEVPRLFMVTVGFKLTDIDPVNLIPFQNSIVFYSKDHGEFEMTSLVDNYKLQGLQEKELSIAVQSFYESTLNYLEREKKEKSDKS